MKIRLVILFFGILVGSFQVYAQQQNSDSLLVIPFQNLSGNPEHNWIGESFAESMSELMRVPGLKVVTNAERKVIHQRLGIPVTTIPSLATALRIAREARVSFILTGSYEIIPAAEGSAEAFEATVRILRVDSGSGEWAKASVSGSAREIIVKESVDELRKTQGLLAYQLLVQRDRSLPFQQNFFVTKAVSVPHRAFESYVKGLLTPDSDATIKENYFRNALKIHLEERGKPYPEAALELGHFYVSRRKFQEAIEHFSRIERNSEQYPEAAFYSGLVRWQQADFDEALTELEPLAEEFGLAIVYNTLGAISLQAARSETKNKAIADARLTKGIEYLTKGLSLKPEDRDLRFNLGLTYFLMGNHAESVSQFRQLLTIEPTEGDATFFLAKSLESINDPTAADVDRQAQRILGDRHSTLQSEWKKSGRFENVFPRVILPPRQDFVTVVLDRKIAFLEKEYVSEADRLMVEIRRAFAEGRDGDAEKAIGRLLISEPMNAEGYLILGQIAARGGDVPRAIENLRTALFWNNRLMPAYVQLIRLYISRNECQQAANFLASAEKVDADHPDLVPIRRQVERCSR